MPINQGNPLFARESKGNPPKGVKFAEALLLERQNHTCKLNVHMFLSRSGHQGLVVRRLISADPGLLLLLLFYPGVFFVCSKAFSSKHHILGKNNKTEFASQAFKSEIKFRTQL